MKFCVALFCLGVATHVSALVKTKEHGATPAPLKTPRLAQAPAPAKIPVPSKTADNAKVPERSATAALGVKSEDLARVRAIQKTFLNIMSRIEVFRQFVHGNTKDALNNYMEPLTKFLGGMLHIKHILGDDFFKDLKPLLTKTALKDPKGNLDPNLETETKDFINKYEQRLLEILNDPKFQPHLLLDVTQLLSARVQRLTKAVNDAVLPSYDDIEKLFSTIPGDAAKNIVARVKSAKKAFYARGLLSTTSKTIS